MEDNGSKMIKRQYIWKPLLGQANSKKVRTGIVSEEVQYWRANEIKDDLKMVT